MPDLIDSILERLSLSSLEMLDKMDLESRRESRQYSEELQKTLTQLENAHLKRCTGEMNNKADKLVWKTVKYKALLDEYTKEFEKVKYMENHVDHDKKIGVYKQQIEHMQEQLSKLTDKAVNLQPEELYSEIHDMHKKIQDLEEKNKELTDKLKFYGGFPANLREAQYCISDIKERLKKKEAMFK